MNDEELSAAAEYINLVVEKQGATCTSVEDGHVFVFKKNFLQNLLDKHPGDDNIVIFIKKPEYNN